GLGGYNIYRNGVFVKAVLASSTSTADSGLLGSTTYAYTITAFDGAGNSSAASGSKIITTPACSIGDATVPSVPTGLAASVASCSQLSLSWNASTDTGGSGLKGYNVYVWRNPSWTFLKQVTTTSTSDIGLAASTTQYYDLAAVDNKGNVSAQSSWAS